MKKKSIFKLGLFAGMALIIFIIVYTAWVTIDLSANVANSQFIDEVKSFIAPFTNKLFLMVGLGVISASMIAIFTVLLNSLALAEQKKQTTIAVEAKDNMAKQQKEIEKTNAMLKSVNEAAKITEDFLMYIQQEDDLVTLTDRIILGLSEHLEASQSAFFVKTKSGKKEIFKLVSSYAFKPSKKGGCDFEKGDGILGQVASDGNFKQYENIPADFLKVKSGLGETGTAVLTVLPVKYKDESIGVIELATFKKVSDVDKEMLLKLANNLGTKITILTK